MTVSSVSINGMNRNQRTMCWLWRTAAVLSALALIVLVPFSLMNVRQQRRAEALVRTLAQFQPGRTSSVEIVKLARSFDFDTEVSAWVEGTTASRIGRDQLKECETAACSIDIVLLLPGQYVSKDWFPRRSEMVRRYIPQKMVLARFGVKRGVLTRVSAILESHDDQPDYAAAGVMYTSEDTAEAVSTPRWKVEKKSGQFSGGFWGGGHFNSVNVQANESVPFEKISRVFDFNPKCLRLRTRCNACEMLKSVCDERNAGGILGDKSPYR